MKLELKFVPQDLWIGLYIDHNSERVKYYLCLVPCFPLVLRVNKLKQEKEAEHDE